MTTIKMLFFLALLMVWDCSAETSFPSQDTVHSWARSLDRTFQELTSANSDVTGANYYKKKYQSSLNNQFSIRRADGREMVTELAGKVSKVFQMNTEALTRLQETAEAAVRDYEYDKDIILPKVSYVNVNDLQNETTHLMGFDAHFGQETIEDQSGVHVPIEIYEGYNPNQMSKICPTCTSVCDLCRNNLFWRQESRFRIYNANIIEDPEILNGLQWSHALDTTFKENKKKYPDIYWQTFGSQNGFMRMYPAARWRTFDDLPDLFDVRRRPWYIHGSVSPKDIIILLDTSGSMHGQSFDIMKLAAKTLLNTLGEDDYVNVAQFSTNVTWVTPCLDTLVQANSRNKRLLFDGIDRLEDLQIATYHSALTFAYEQFEQFEASRDSQDGANCHKLIMVFSDGGTEYPAEVVARYTNKTANPMTSAVRIFTYAVGPHPLPTTALKYMACGTGGAFSAITAMGAIRTKIQNSYLSVIAHPEVLSRQHVLGYSSVYEDAVDYARVLSKPLVLSNSNHFLGSVHFSHDFMGLGLVTTITLPVFNTSATSDNQTLAGVVGVDIPVFKFEDLSPRHKLGPLGYTFAINQNGFLVFHPGLWMDANFMEDPSHIDLSSLEGDNAEIEDLRREMIERPAKPRVFDYPDPLDMEERMPLRGKRKYHFVRVEGSSFTLGLAEDEHWNYLEVPHDIDLGSLRALDPAQTHVAKWNFCQRSSPFDREVTLPGLVAAIEQGSCQSDSIRHLAWDASVVSDAFAGSRASPNNAAGISSRFVSTDGGLTLFSPSAAASTYESISNPHNSSMYRLAVSHRTPRLFVQRFYSKELLPKPRKRDRGRSTVTDRKSARRSQGKLQRPQQPLFFKLKPATVHLTSPVVVERGGKTFVAAVAGAQLEPSYLQQLLMQSARSVGGGGGRDEWDCRNASELACYLLDDGARVLASNQDLVSVEAGDFLGLVDPHLMSELAETANVFDFTEDFNYQALCNDNLECCSLGVRSILLPTIDALVYLIQNLAGALQQMGHVVVSLLSLLVLPGPAESASEYGFKIPEGLHRCTTKTLTYFLRKDAPKEFHRRLTANCSGGNCERDYHLYRLENINAMLVVADPKCKNCHAEPYMDGPQEAVEFQESCLLPKRFRKRPEECFASDPQEVPECTSSAQQLSKIFLVQVVLSVIVVYRSLLIQM